MKATNDILLGILEHLKEQSANALEANDSEGLAAIAQAAVAVVHCLRAYSE